MKMCIDLILFDYTDVLCGEPRRKAPDYNPVCEDSFAEMVDMYGDFPELSACSHFMLRNSISFSSLSYFPFYWKLHLSGLKEQWSGTRHT